MPKGLLDKRLHTTLLPAARGMDLTRKLKMRHNFSEVE
jgi:hypothetical protein